MPTPKAYALALEVIQVAIEKELESKNVPEKDVNITLSVRTTDGTWTSVLYVSSCTKDFEKD